MLLVNVVVTFVYYLVGPIASSRLFYIGLSLCTSASTKIETIFFPLEEWKRTLLVLLSPEGTSAPSSVGLIKDQLSDWIGRSFDASCFIINFKINKEIKVRYTLTHGHCISHENRLFKFTFSTYIAYCTCINS